MSIRLSAAHSANASRRTRESLEPASNVTVERLMHLEKHDSEIVSTEQGTQIACSDEQLANADSPRVKILEPVSNTILKRFPHSEKHKSAIVSIDEGIEIHFSDEHL
jgi:hypothetical protein